MKITVEELHQATAKYVRLAAQLSIEVEDSGRLLAVLQPAWRSSSPSGGGTFMARDSSIRQMPLITVDSTDIVSADRDDR